MYSHSNFVVRKTEIGDVEVSTVWLDEGLGFETMVFGGEWDHENDRSATEEQAIAGHEQMVARVRATLS